MHAIAKGFAALLLLLLGLTACGGPSVSVILTPDRATLRGREHQSFKATVVGSGDQTVLWASDGGLIKGSGPSIRFIAPAEAGRYEVRATSRIEPRASAVASIVVSAEADLVVGGVVLTPTTVEPGGHVTVTFDVSNLGNTEAHASITQLRLNTRATDVTVEDALLLELETATIAPGAKRTLGPDVTIPAGTPVGGYYVWVVPDVTGEAGQSYRANDTAFAYLSVAEIPKACSDPAETILIPDPNLRSAIVEALGGATADVTCGAMATLTDLPAPARGIRKLDGLQHAVNLQSADLGGNELEEATPLTNLTHLHRLVLRGNRILDLTPLAGLTSLGVLDVSGNPIADLRPLAGLTALTDVSVSGIEVSDLTPLARLTNLTTLDLEHNRIIDLTPLSNLTHLTSLNLGYNEVSDLTPLIHLTNLISLDLDANRITDLRPLAHLGNLTELALWDNLVVDLTPLRDLTRLTSLSLGANDIRDITPLAGLTNLTTLSLDGNPLGDATALAGLTNLTSLHLDATQLGDLSFLAGLSTLYSLRLTKNRITDLTPLTGLTGLGHVHLDENRVSDLTPLVQNPGIDQFDWVYLRNNCLDLSAGSAASNALQTLLDRDVRVQVDPQDDCTP